ncbi:antirestriction protein [Salmonella enterica]|nr:antirestriction protein [Salmonella enterica]EKR1149046.1 antirestriction protein [Salmonella enterica]EKR1150514.1 antirestriction protein [Salmonella enterica]
MTTAFNPTSASDAELIPASDDTLITATPVEDEDRLCTDYSGGIWQFYTLSNGGAFMAPEANDGDDVWSLYNGMNGNSTDMSPEAAGITACLLEYSHHACRTNSDLMTAHYYRLRDYALNHPECSAIMHITD